MMNRLLQLLALQLILLVTVSNGLFSSSKIKHSTKFELQQKVLTLGTSYTVKDDHGQSVYKVRFYIKSQDFILYLYIKIGFKQLGLGKHLQLTDVSGQKEYYSSKNTLKLI
jgi:uncharacterized protein YxjI